jgi:hypothetical protein
MGRRNKKQRPAYYRARRLTVGMLEDLCKAVADKTAVVSMTDRSGQLPEMCLRGYHLLNKETPIGLNLVANFSWGVTEDSEEPDPTEDTEISEAMAELVCAYYDKEYAQGDCVTPIPGLVEYMGVVESDPKRDITEGASNGSPG